MPQMAIEFGGSVTIDSDDVRFENINDGTRISGTQYLELPANERSRYLVDSLGRVIQDGDASFEFITFLKENELGIMEELPN